MATNKFATRCARCGETVLPGTGIITGDIGSRSVTHADCGTPVEHHRSFTVRSRALVPDLLVLPDAGTGARRRRVAAGAAAVGVVALAGLSVLLFTGEDNEGTTRTTGNLQPTTTVESPSTTVATQVAGAVEQRPATTVAVLPVAVVTGQPATSTPAPAVNEVPVAAPVAPPSTSPPATAPPSTAPRTVPPTAPPTVPPTAPPTTVPVTAPPTTAAPTTTKPKAPTTTKPPAPTTTKRRGILGLGL